MLVQSLVRYKFSILVALLIVLVSLVPGTSMPDSSLFNIPALDKLVHFGMYTVLGFMVILESRDHITGFRKHVLLISGLFLLGTLIEVLQATVVATRSAEWLDLLANLTGLIAGALAFRLFKWIIS